MSLTSLAEECLSSTGRWLQYLLLTGAAALSHGTEVKGAAWDTAGIEATQADGPLPIAVAVDVMEDYARFIGTRDPLTMTDFSGPYARRDVVELILLQQALHMGGFREPIVFVPEYSYRRAIRQMAAGQLISTGASKWRIDLAGTGDALLISDPLVEDGDFIVGIYTLEANRNIQQADAEQLRQWRIISNRHWRADVHTIQTLGFGRITYGGDWLSMVRMLDAGRAELVLAPFPSGDNLAIEVNGSRLLPVQNITVAISGSRHWAVSRAHPQGAVFFQALQVGLKQLRQNGLVTKAYRQSGFFNAATDRWPVMQPPPGSGAIATRAPPKHSSSDSAGRGPAD